MQEKFLYEYAVIRVLPVVEREEFLNVGIIVFCKKANFIKVYFNVNQDKLNCFSNDVDIEELFLNLASMQKIADGNKEAGLIAQQDIPSRFRWLTAVRSSAIQTSRPHPGLSNDLEQTTLKLFEELVL